MLLDIDADVADARWVPLWPGMQTDLEQICGHILRKHDIDLESRAVEVSFLLTSDVQVRMLNHEHRGKDKPTNVLSFPSGEALDGGCFVGLGPPLMLGDVALAFETVAREAGEKTLSVRDHAVHLVIHGVLHLLGFDHQNDAEAEEMEAKEIAFCRDFGIANPYDA